MSLASHRGVSAHCITRASLEKNLRVHQTNPDYVEGIVRTIQHMHNDPKDMYRKYIREGAGKVYRAILRQII